jgi:hypothetical protein
MGYGPRFKAPSCCADQQLDPTDTKVSIDAFVQYTRFFGYLSIAICSHCLRNLAVGQFIRRISRMTQLAEPTEFHIAAIEKFLSTAKARITDAKGRRFMTKFGRSIAMICVFLGVLALAPNSWGQNRAPIIEQIAKTYGLDSFGKIEAIRYTWNGEITGLFKASHTWEWEPKTGKISFEGKDKDGKLVKVTYLQSQLNSQPANVKDQIAPSFVNDNYWLLFPLHAYWDTSATVTDQGMHKLPLGGGSATLVTVKYPTEAGGYTPGDTWDLYVGKNDRVEQFVYHRGSAKPPKLVIATWAGYKKAGPLLISTEHRGTADGKPLHIFISDVSVKLTGSDTWMKAE